MPSARQIVERLPRLGEAGPEPALRLLAGELLQQLDGLADGLALVGEQVHRALDDPVAHELPAGVEHRAGDRLVGFHHVGVDGGGGADLPLGERVQQPPEPHPHPVVVPRPVGHVGHDGHALGRRQVLARHRLLDVPLLDVDDGPHRDAGALGELPGWAGGEGRVVEAIAGQSHGASSVAESTRLYGKRQGGQGPPRVACPARAAAPEVTCTVACEAIAGDGRSDRPRAREASREAWPRCVARVLLSPLTMRAPAGRTRRRPVVVPVVVIVALVAAAFACLATVPPRAEAATVRHVDRSDSTCGGRAPCYGSIQAAVNAAQPGDTVQVRAGTYVEQVNITGKNASAVSEASRIVIQADPTVPAGSVVLHGAVAQCAQGHAIRLQQSRFVTIRGLTITGAGGAGIALLGGSSSNVAIRIERNRIVGNGAAGCDGGSGVSIAGGNAGTLVLNNVIVANGRNGIATTDPDGGPHTIVQNTIHGNGWNGLSATRAHVLLLANNAITGNGTQAGSTGGRVGVRRETGSALPAATIVLRNNLVCGNRLGEMAGPVLDAIDGGNLTPTGAEGPGVATSPGCELPATVYRDLAGADHAPGSLDDDPDAGRRLPAHRSRARPAHAADAGPERTVRGRLLRRGCAPGGRCRGLALAVRHRCGGGAPRRRAARRGIPRAAGQFASARGRVGARPGFRCEREGEWPDPAGGQPGADRHPRARASRGRDHRHRELEHERRSGRRPDADRRGDGPGPERGVRRANGDRRQHAAGYGDHRRARRPGHREQRRVLVHRDGQPHAGGEPGIRLESGRRCLRPVCRNRIRQRHRPDPGRATPSR